MYVPPFTNSVFLIPRPREPLANVLIKGSGTIKAGFAGEEQPKTFFPS